jgi:hypothetical protein
MSVWMTEDDFRAIGFAKGVREVCLGDAWERFRDYSGSAGEFFDETKSEKIEPAPHWWAAPALDTPDEAALYSVQAQGEYVKAHGEAAARGMLAAEGLKLGQVKKRPAPDHTSNNPYAPAAPGKEAARMDAIIALLKSASPTLINSLAKSAGCRIDGTLIPQK